MGVVGLMTKLLFTLSIVFSLNVNAMYAAIYQESRTSLDVKRRTHFVIAGEGKELLIKTQEAALTKALYLKKMFPQDQVIFISDFVDPEDSFKWNQLEVVHYVRSREPYLNRLSAVTVIDYLDWFSQIASIEIFSHANIHNGVLLAKGYQIGTFAEHFVYAGKLKNNFTSDAYAIMFGCNSGWMLAPRLSEVWGIPVAGSFTGSIVERIGPGGVFYDVDHKTVQFPESNLGVSCEAGACLRMVVQNAPYGGLWGRFEVKALNFFKFFCRGLKDNMDRCFKGMAQSVLGAVHGFKNLKVKDKINFQTYRSIVNEFLCSKNWQGRRDDCIHFLNSYDLKSKSFALPRNSFYMLGNQGQLHADFEGHNYKITVLDDVQMMAVKRKYEFTEITDVKNVDTLAREFEAYMQAFKTLNQN